MKYTGFKNHGTKLSKISSKLQNDKNNAIIVEQTELIYSDVKLTIGILVSNRVKYIRKTMESIKPLLEAIPSELVVLDTMGEKGDGSIDIVREYTDKIYLFPWCDDFSVARNVCLDHAKGEWFLFLDDDEWFDDVQELINFFQSGEEKNYYSGGYYVRSYLLDGTYSVGIVKRLIRRTNTTRFVGKVHESFNQIFSPSKQFSCFIHHYGYFYINDKEREAKQQRNLPLLQADIAENGLTPSRAAQLVQEFLVREETWEEGYQSCMSSIMEMQKKGKLNHSCSQWLLVASVRCFSEKDNKRALEQAEYVYSNYTMTEIGAMALAFVAAIAAIKENEFTLGRKYCDIYLKHWDWKQEHEEKALQQTALDFPKFMTEKSYHEIIYIAAAIANQDGEYALANQYWKRMSWDKVDGKKYMADLNDTIQGLKRQQEKLKITEKLKEFLTVLDSLKEVLLYYKTEIETDRINIQEQQEFLTGMQETAITIGTGLDKLLGENTEEVSLLEKFCELVWSCSNTSTKEEKQKIIISMQQIVEEVEEELKLRT